jgi:two-component system OmpR family sensor kinase
VATLLGFWLVRVGLQPLSQVELTAKAIAGGDLEHRVAYESDRTEVGNLAGAFNVMLERIEGLVSDLRASEARLRRFVGDASHELRTPIAAVSAYAQLFDTEASLTKDELQRVMQGIEYESSRMARLVEDLLTLAKLDEHPVLATAPVELVGLVHEAVETSRLVGPDWPVAFEADDAVEVVGNHQALRQVIDNLLANVRAHTPPGTRTVITVSRHADEAVITVTDDGPGISHEQAGQLFERFYRADSSRSRETGGAGLGLAIVASIVQAHEGTVVAEPRSQQPGTVLRLSLPAAGPEPLQA